MINAGKVVRQLELQLDDLQKYAADGELLTLTQEQAKEMIALLKDQDAMRVLSQRKCETLPNHYERKGFCPKCHQVVEWFLNRSYCGFCGQAVKWE